MTGVYTERGTKGVPFMIVVELYQGGAGLFSFRSQKWRFRAVAENGRVIAVASEAYTNKDDARKAAALVFREDAQITEV